MSDRFRDPVTSDQRGEDAPSRTDWLAESRRRALLADVSVRIVGPAPLSVLPVRHQAPRPFGPSSRILIVDEVHEMAYIGREPERLLQMHRAAGGLATLMTATLLMALQAWLLASYGGGNPGRAHPALPLTGGEARADFVPDDRPLKGAGTGRADRQRRGGGGAAGRGCGARRDLRPGAQYAVGDASAAVRRPISGALRAPFAAGQQRCHLSDPSGRSGAGAGSGADDRGGVAAMGRRCRDTEALGAVRGCGPPLPDQSPPEIAAITQDWANWERAEVVLCPIGEDGVICEGVRYEGSLGILIGSPD